MHIAHVRPHACMDPWIGSVIAVQFSHCSPRMHAIITAHDIQGTENNAKLYIFFKKRNAKLYYSITYK